MLVLNWPSEFRPANWYNNSYLTALPRCYPVHLRFLAFMLTSRHPQRFLLSTSWLVVVITLSLFFPVEARALNPDSPEVKQMVDRALKWLETQNDDRLGGKCLIGLSFFKAKRGTNHPQVRAALAACEAATRGDASTIDNYSIGLALIFLLETDPARNHSLSRLYVSELLRRQQRGGAWGYTNSVEGDTSQTQYPTLGLWLALNHEIDVPINAIERDCAWLLRTQDPSGAWGYQGNDPGNFQRVNQNEVRPALAAAGLGSLYMCANMLGINENTAAAEDKSNSAAPPALRPVGDPLGFKRQVSRAIDPRLIRRAMTDGNYWFSRNYTLDSEGHTFYYLYALERYQSFRELAEGRSDPNPRWYNDVVAKLKKAQAASGEWNDSEGDVIATCFGVLTLLRSAKATIAKAVAGLGDGVLLGGPGTEVDLLAALGAGS